MRKNSTQPIKSLSSSIKISITRLELSVDFVTHHWRKVHCLVKNCSVPNALRLMMSGMVSLIMGHP